MTEARQRNAPHPPPSTGSFASSDAGGDGVAAASASAPHSSANNSDSYHHHHRDESSSPSSSSLHRRRPLRRAADAPGGSGNGDSSSNRNHNGRDGATATCANSASTAGGDGASAKGEEAAAWCSSVPAAVAAWYLLGVVSIATSKLLLAEDGAAPSSKWSVSPLLLTLQQLTIGATLLRALIALRRRRHRGSGGRGGDGVGSAGGWGVQPVPLQDRDDGDDGDALYKGTSYDGPRCVESGNNNTQGRIGCGEVGILSAMIGLVPTPSSSRSTSDGCHGGAGNFCGGGQGQRQRRRRIHDQLLLSSIYFALGFLLTNHGFSSGSAAFVETVKAAEPFTSASVAMAWGVERPGAEEVSSLTGIVAGVALSTLGSGGSPSDAAAAAAPVEGTTPSRYTMALSCLVVMAANLCFSFRGLHQKLLRATPRGSARAVDDLNLQYMMQSVGILLLLVPALLCNASSMVHGLRRALLFGGGGNVVTHGGDDEPWSGGGGGYRLARYVLLATVNGAAFASYNLASTYVLTRLSVVHHAALNCIRRVFAIVVTSLLFGLGMTLLQVFGITLAVGGFFCYLHFKLERQGKEARRRELQRKWGRAMMESKSGRWVGKKSPSLLLPAGNVG